MINEFYFLSELYDDIYCWLATNTPGERVIKRYFVKKNKKVWDRIRDKFIELESKSDLSLLEKDFLKCKYIGKAYRKIRCQKKHGGYVYSINCYQSCSKTLRGLKHVSMCGDVVLIELFSNKYSYSIDIIELLMFMCKNGLIVYKDEFEKNFRDIERLNRYIDEEEVIVVISKDNIKKISMRNFETGFSLSVDKEEWFRDTLN